MHDAKYLLCIIFEYLTFSNGQGSRAWGELICDMHLVLRAPTVKDVSISRLRKWMIEHDKLQ